MAKLIILVFSLLGLLSACVGQYVQPGQCDPNVPLVENFNIDDFLGTWYEYSRADNPNQNGDCARYEFTRNNGLNVRHYSVNSNFAEDVSGTVSQVTNTARLALTIPSFPNPIDFWVRLTDYNTFALTFSCENISTTQRRIHVWILARERAAITEMTLALISTTLSNTFNINANTLRSIDHSESSCYVLPVIAPGQPIVLPGQCDANIPAVPNFNVGRFLGVWHEVASYETANSNGACVRAQYTEGATGVNVLNSQVVNNNLLTIDGTASVSSTDGSAQLSVLLNLPGGVQQTQELRILASDYDTFAISYSCQNVGTTQKRVFSWILSRTRQLPASSQVLVDQAINSFIDLNERYYTPTDQSDQACFFYPEPVPNRPVVFRGQCESVNVRAMPNFDAVAYMGLWHNIELYPAPFQSASTCSNAFYELVDGRVDVLNTQVVNQSLATVRGFAVPVSTDGSAELVVSFPIAGTDAVTTTDYWVLATDYTNYALVYTCFNVNADEMQVGSWKLSRTKQLTPASATAINAVINTVTVLDQRYYEVTDQSVQGCFYFPEAQPGVPVVFPGQCDQTVAAVPNFNFQSFQGTWYEIEAYPKAEQSGQCIYHQYSFVSASQLNLVSSSVTDQFLGLTNSVVRPVSNDNTGRLTITITNPDGTTIDIPFWVISTDYNDYALAYACSNIGTDFRGVWSWKLSRTKTLSAAANTTINNVIANNVVLDNVYYQNIDQSDRACSYLPDLAPGDAIILPGQCDTSITGVPNFNLARYVGRWRMIESYASNFQTGTCNVGEYTQTSANTFAVTNSQVIGQNLATISGTATVMTTDGTGKLLINFPSNNQNFEFTVLDTDYDSYALGYGCVNLNANQRRVYSWKLSRSNTLSQVAINNMNRIINNIEVLNNRFYYTVDRSEAGCFYFPEPNPNSIVRFRGTCNQNIPVVTNFQAERYLGLWHDIESYPGDFQDGTCNNAYYSPGNDVDVFNTQVINQELRTISGSASLVPSTDGSAKLRVTFNVGGVDVTTDYWVLATDYTTYSLVYSCRPVDDEFVQITSWKLSRTKSLPAAAASAINAVMNTIPVLDQRYFLTRDQTPEGCFYFPEPRPGVEVTFPGQCDNTLAAVPNFNMASFQGTWHEVQAYPKDDQPGQCVNHQFTSSSANVLGLVSSSVYDRTLSLTTGNVRFTSTDGSGRLMISITSSAGVPVDIPYWILSTDYTNYALAYSCVNQGSDFRKIWSWKLSRTQQLSAAAVTAINAAIAPINVLGNQYFENIDQSDQACFHLPNITPGDQVTLPGQCDNSITGVPNFNIQRFAGRWRLIESYGSRFQTGTCNTARYTVENSNTLGITNSQVVNQGLASISGTGTVISTDGTGKLLISFPSRTSTYEYTILDTDYDSYALGYGCVNLPNNQRSVRSWKFSRDNTLSATANNNINQIINRIDVLHQPYYYTVDRSEAGCFYYPPAESNTTVRFRGQCDESIPVVNNFDVGRYAGLWHDIQSYPVPFQDGSCPNAYYAPFNSTTVTVLNTHIVNQALGTINGFATIATTDGTAKLNVTFNVMNNDVTTNYWVLATDYSSYAFVYSCANLDDEYMFVASWKLSRTKALTQAATTAINNIMSNYNILDQRYFINRDQSADGCFYFPEPEVGKPVVFPGQCDNSIQAIPNFNMNQFQGVWHEIASYPKNEQTGQCISHQFEVNGTNSMHLDSSSILSQSLSTTIGHVTFGTTDGSGRMIINIVADGQSIQIPYWILDTDYNNYALAYSCVNLDSDTRGVWSWKLSRTKQLSAAANAAINTAIANVNVLRNEYYENIQQTDSACFYLPDLGPTDPVEFPGQCDPNIPVVQNFNVNRYLGRWRLIESYYTLFQQGTCNAATYTQGPGNSVTVVNTKVQLQQLASITGSAVPATNDGSGKLLVTFPISDGPAEYWILSTDYDSYALVYSCLNLPNDRRRVWSWKLSRTNTLTAAANAAINQVVNSVNVLEPRYFNTVDRSDAACFYFPEPNSATNVVFPGQCDQNIPAVANFNPNLYAGTWYDIESYPTNFQSGTCNTATYTVNDNGSVSVRNTQVVEQILQTTTGTAVRSTTDGTGKLSVTFNLSSGDVTTDYWILATDYSSYSLVYSCRNIDDEFRAVYSWKLSRQRALPAAGSTAINNVINTVQVLDQRYFVQRNHTEEGCFYYPNNQGGDVILNGQCVADANVPAVTNFNANSFSGTWHEIARFPSALQNGECANTDYTVSGTNQFNVVQRSVFDEALLTTTTQGSLPAGGRGVISINVNGVPFDNVYILGTDYSQYALAYSCRNLNATSKQIYSWKLSRSREGLTPAANEAVDQLVSSNIDLFELYYRYTYQDDAACFYYPEFDTLPIPITLPGPCNTTIRGVPNFDASAYLGRWYDLARYPQTAQSGQCNRAQYSDLGNGLVSVVNSQVINENLATISGEARASSDGRLEVTFVVGGETRIQYLYVLATDYVNYALAYTCVDLQDGRRQVGSWKLSRRTTFTPQANAAMDAVISRTQGLNQAYYQDTSQSDDACFYVPPVNPNQAPRFRGQCGDITADSDIANNFQAQDFVGAWHEIERYPLDNEVGECLSTQYNYLTGSGVYVDTSVSDRNATTVEGTVIASSDGRLRRQLSDGSHQDIWVLSTDYSSYALLYSCENDGPEYRKVWSAKHSRTRSLTPQAELLMAPAIQRNRLLYTQFYQNVNQTDDACFYYPDIPTGEDVILPGSCDTTISGMPAFNVADFAGTWYQVRRYDESAGRTCIGNRLVHDAESGNINVVAFEVVNGEWTSVEGTARISSTDGTGQLTITMPTAAGDGTETTEVYILATDYTTYALAYSCEDVDASPLSPQRRVRAWQLSAQRTMSPEGVTAIAELVEEKDELHDPYFSTISHDGECQEPIISSAFLFKSSIIVILLSAILQLVW